ncbi:hypothetical protein DV737_g4376, partial [Chaetothyriales sp. CBS 132003]
MAAAENHSVGRKFLIINVLLLSEQKHMVRAALEVDDQKSCTKFIQDKGKIPEKAIADANGVAIFTGFRAGMYLAGTRSSGVVVARLSNGTWSPPSAFSVRSGSFGIVYGVDVYDCVCVLNTQAALDAYTKSEVNLGGAVGLIAGPVSFTTRRDAEPVWVYTKSRGIYGGVTVNRTAIQERRDINAHFYGSQVTSKQILNGQVVPQDSLDKWPAGAMQLIEILKVAEGMIADPCVLQGISNESTPGDMQE